MWKSNHGPLPESWLRAWVIVTCKPCQTGCEPRLVYWVTNFLSIWHHENIWSRVTDFADWLKSVAFSACSTCSSRHIFSINTGYLMGWLFTLSHVNTTPGKGSLYTVHNWYSTMCATGMCYCFSLRSAHQRPSTSQLISQPPRRPPPPYTSPLTRHHQCMELSVDRWSDWPC